MSKTEELKALFEEWKDCHANESDNEYLEYHKEEKGSPNYIPKQNFISDWILDEPKYNAAQTKILYIAKECNAYKLKKADKDKEIEEEIDLDYEDFWAKKEVEDCVYRNIPLTNTLLKGIAMLNNAIINNDYFKPNKNPASLLNIAFMNLNKRGGLNNCVWDTLYGYVEKYKDKISEQIRIIDPDIIICCGQSVKEDIVDKFHLAETKVKVVWAYHPSYRRISDISKLEKLKENMENAGLVIDTDNNL